MTAIPQPISPIRMTNAGRGRLIARVRRDLVPDRRAAFNRDDPLARRSLGSRKPTFSPRAPRSGTITPLKRTRRRGPSALGRTRSPATPRPATAMLSAASTSACAPAERSKRTARRRPTSSTQPGSGCARNGEGASRPATGAVLLSCSRGLPETVEPGAFAGCSPTPPSGRSPAIGHLSRTRPPTRLSISATTTGACYARADGTCLLLSGKSG